MSGDCMTFPETAEEFMEQYKIVDDEKVYTNGADLVPIFRMMQWLEHVSATDTISRQAAIDAMAELQGRASTKAELKGYSKAWKRIKQLPPIQPEIIRCKDCKHHWTHKCMDSMPIERCDLEQTFYDAEHDFCSLAERRTDGID